MDEIALEYRYDKKLQREQLSAAFKSAAGKGRGRMGKVMVNEMEGFVRVFMWVDVGDLAFGNEEEGEGELNMR